MTDVFDQFEDGPPEPEATEPEPDPFEGLSEEEKILHEAHLEMERARIQEEEDAKARVRSAARFGKEVLRKEAAERAQREQLLAAARGGSTDPEAVGALIEEQTRGASTDEEWFAAAGIDDSPVSVQRP